MASFGEPISPEELVRNFLNEEKHSGDLDELMNAALSEALRSDPQQLGDEPKPVDPETLRKQIVDSLLQTGIYAYIYYDSNLSAETRGSI